MTNKEPASIRYKNPGAMWGGKFASSWGATKTVALADGTGQGNTIANFPTFVQGIAAQVALWRTARYRNKRFKEAIIPWSGGNNVPSYIRLVAGRVPGFTGDTIINDDFLLGPHGIEFLKAQAFHEAGREYPATDAEWIEGRDRAFAKGANVKGKVIVTARTIGGALATATTAATAVNEIAGPVSQTVEQVRVVTDAAGNAVAVSKRVVEAVPQTFVEKALATAQSPTFLISVIVVMAVAWGVTWYLRRKEG